MTPAYAPLPRIEATGKTVVVFGAGYVGGAWAEACAHGGGQVWALTRNGERASALAAQGIHPVVGDIASPDWHHQMPDRPDWVLNAVASGGGGEAAYRQVYYEGMQSVLAWTRKAQPHTLIYTSSTSVYSQTDDVWVDETQPAEPSLPTGRVLSETEQCLINAPANGVARWFILRLAGIYGPGRHYMLDALSQGQTVFPGHGDYRLNLIHRDDILGALEVLYQSPPSLANRLFNVADDSPSPKAEVVGWLARRLGLAAPVFDPSVASLRPSRQFAGTPPNRRISNQALKDATVWRPRFPDDRAGYEALL
jgi:nucleoside-diphosphate-sugar epimerase